jgi:hypothetical protein
MTIDDVRAILRTAIDDKAGDHKLVTSVVAAFLLESAEDFEAAYGDDDDPAAVVGSMLDAFDEVAKRLRVRLGLEPDPFAAEAANGTGRQPSTGDSASVSMWGSPGGGGQASDYDGYVIRFVDVNGGPLLTCPDCGHGLATADGDVVAQFVSNGSSRRVRTCLDSTGTLPDLDGSVTAGHHAGTMCGKCGRELSDYEEERPLRPPLAPPPAPVDPTPREPAAAPADPDETAYCKRYDRSVLDDGWVVVRREEDEEMHGNTQDEEVKAYCETEYIADMVLAGMSGKIGDFDIDEWY